MSDTTVPTPPTLSSFWRDLPREGRLLLSVVVPDHLRGRYNALSAGAFSLAAIIAPAIAGWLMGHSLGSAYIAMLVVGCAAVVWVSLRLEPQLPAGVNGVPSTSEADDVLSVR
jgi:MFS family permease